MADRNTGGRFDAFLEEQGILDEVDAVAVKRVIAWQLRKEMTARRISQKALACIVSRPTGSLSSDAQQWISSVALRAKAPWFSV